MTNTRHTRKTEKNTDGVPADGAVTTDGRDGHGVGEHTTPTPAKTSPAAAFALVFGLVAFISALTGVLAPLALLCSIVGIVLGVIGRKKANRPLRTGKTLATSGLVLSILALLLGIAVTAGAITALFNPSLLDPVQQQLQSLMNS